VRRHDAFHPLQHLQAALGLARLARLGAKPIDERGDLGDPAHLTRLQPLLQCQLLDSLLLELRVIAGIRSDGLVLDVQHPIDDGIEEFAVMRDHQQGAGERGQPFLQPDDGVEIQVIGGFVQQQQIGPRSQCARHGQAHPPPARELGNRALEIRGIESQAMHEGCRPRPRPIAVDGLQQSVEFGQLHGRIPPLRVLDGRHDAAQFGIAVEDEFDCGALARGDFLLHVGNLQCCGALDVAPVRSQLAANGGK